MSVQFGRWNFVGQPPAPDYFEKVGAALAPYGPDSNESYSNGGVGILYRAFHTTRESRLEEQPHISCSGAVITWDGRLDNGADLVSELHGSVTVSSTDVAIVAAAYEKWGPNCLGKLIGDWAMSIWNPRERSLLLAKDPIGTRHLYYSFDNNQVTWSTILDPLVLFAGRNFEICEEYIAGWLSVLPAPHLTPYVGIYAVPPSSTVQLRTRKQRTNQIVSKYWHFDPGKKLRYSNDAEYEEHFRTVFATSVQRRLRSDGPILAELSGGMDSSCIVCIADLVLAQAKGDHIKPHLNIAPISNPAPRLDTISWFDQSDVAIDDERSYLTKVELKRGRSGYHIDLGARKRIENAERSQFSKFESNRLSAIPGFNHTWPITEPYSAYLTSERYRTILSGIGGEHPTGGYIPTPRTELQDLLARGHFITLVRQLKAWAAKMRTDQLPLLWEAVRGVLTRSLGVTGTSGNTCPAPWIHSGFVKRNRSALRGYPSRVKLFDALPSFQDHIHDLNHLRSLLAYLGGLRCYLDVPREVRYPYLDRDLLEFAYAIPQDQLVRVGQRRFLMKRALAGIVPAEVLKRRPRASVAEKSGKDALTGWPSLTDMGNSFSSSFGIIEPNRLLNALQKAQRKEEVDVETLERTLILESWLRHLAFHGVLTNSQSVQRQEYYLPSERLGAPKPSDSAQRFS